MSSDAPGQVKNRGKILQGDVARGEAPMRSSRQEHARKFAVVSQFWTRQGNLPRMRIALELNRLRILLEERSSKAPFIHDLARAKGVFRGEMKKACFFSPDFPRCERGLPLGLG